MPAPRKEEKAEAMRSAYESGLSLAEVASQFGCTRQSVYGTLKSRGVELRTVAPRPEQHFNGRKYTLRAHGYFGATTEPRTLMHRDVWEHHRGQIPDGWDVHHLDEVKSNNEITNLECLPKAEHTRLYSPHNNQYTRGRKRSVCNA